MVTTEACELREPGDRKPLGKVFFHMLGDEPPLPRRQASPVRSFAVPHVRALCASSCVRTTPSAWP